MPSAWGLHWGFDTNAPAKPWNLALGASPSCSSDVPVAGPSPDDEDPPATLARSACGRGIVTTEAPAMTCAGSKENRSAESSAERFLIFVNLATRRVSLMN